MAKTTKIKQEVIDRIIELDRQYEDCSELLRFWKREAYLAKSASPYVKRSKLDDIERTIANITSIQDSAFAELRDTRLTYKLTWDDIITITADRKVK